MDSDAQLIEKFNDISMSSRTSMISKEVAYIPDSNSGSYNGQVTFDLSSLGQTNKWLSYGEAYIMMPYVVSMKSSADWTVGSPTGPYVTNSSICLKDGFHQLIDNVQVEYNQKTVCQTQNFNNMHTQFKLLSKSSAEDFLKNGPSLGFIGDTVDSYTYAATGTASGVGYVNTTGNIFAVQRAGLVADSEGVVSAFPRIYNAERVEQAGSSYYKNNAEAAENRIYYWVYMAQIRLSDITDFFDRIPLCKSTDLRITLTYNSCTMDITKVITSKIVTITNYSQLSGHSCPYMFFNNDKDVAGVLTITSGIVKTSQVSPNTPINSCRLYVPMYKINDQVSLKMLQSYPVTKFEYNDLFTFVIPSQAKGAFTHTLSTGIINPQYLIVIPVPKTNSLGGLFGISTYQSPFDSCPGTTSNVGISDFNCMVGGENVFQNNQKYEFETFINEVAKLNAIEGNNVLGFTSGILDFNKWRKAYRYYVADLRRREQSNDNVTKSIVLSGTNACANEIIELICIIAYRKSVSINTMNGTSAD